MRVPRGRIRVAAVLLAVPLVVMVLFAVPNVAYWGQPDQPTTVTGANPAGAATRGRTTCAAARFTVLGPAGREGSFHGCADAHVLGERLTVRWRSGTSPDVRVDPLGGGTVLRIGGLSVLLTVAVAVLVAGLRRRRR